MLLVRNEFMPMTWQTIFFSFIIFELKDWLVIHFKFVKLILAKIVEPNMGKFYLESQ